MASLVPGKVIGRGVLKLEAVQVIYPVCGQQTEAVARDGQVKGYCTMAIQYLNFPVETQRVRMGKHPTAETREVNELVKSIFPFLLSFCHRGCH